jgi:hypothetical protein
MQNCPKIFKHQDFSSSQLFYHKGKFFNLCSLPETIRQHKNSQTAENISNIQEKIYQEFSKVVKFFGQHGKTNPKLPQAAQTFCTVWKTPQCEWFNIGLN